MFCKNCGKQLPDSAVFCSNCGTKVDPAFAPGAPVSAAPPADQAPPVNANPAPAQEPIPAIPDSAPPAWNPAAPLPGSARPEQAYAPSASQTAPVFPSGVQQTYPQTNVPPMQPAPVHRAAAKAPNAIRPAKAPRIFAFLALVLMVGAAVLVFLNTHHFRLYAAEGSGAKAEAGDFWYSMLGLKPLMGNIQPILLIAAVAGFAAAALLLLFAGIGAARGRLPFVLALVFGLIGLGCFGAGFYLASQFPAGEAWEKTWRFMMEDDALFSQWYNYLSSRQAVPNTEIAPSLYGFALFGAGGLGVVLSLFGALTGGKKKG